jgi:hypothetical protein
MIDSSALLVGLKAQLRVLQADLKAHADDASSTWGAALQKAHAEALRRERTGLSWMAWRDNEVDQAAVAWIVATTFVRFCEDNDLLAGATLDGLPVAVGWIAGPGERTVRARENQTAYFRVNKSHHDRDWLQEAFQVLSAQPAGASLVDSRHNPVWTAEISADAAKELIDFWRRTRDDGTLVHDFTDPGLDTRFLGDLYQDLSDHAKKTYALLQTPEFVEEFILDRTLTPAIAEFGVDGLRLIDPTCGSGHFLLGAFERINRQWAIEAPGMDPKQRVRKAMDSIHGVDLNPFAVAIARFRLTVGGILASGDRSLVGIEDWGFHLAIGDSLLGEQGVTSALFGDETYSYKTEDLGEYTDILKPGRYHVVVGNPPYITVKDKVLNQIYRKAYTTAAGKYALSVPFMELFFRLAIKGGAGQGAGLVGQITSNSFMKREFGKKVIEDLFAGYHLDNPVDLTHVIDTSGAYIPGHGTPTVILIGRRRRPVATEVRAVLGVRGEPGTPKDPARGLVWTEIVEHIDTPGFDGTYVSVTDVERAVLSSHPWSLTGGGASEVFAAMESQGKVRLRSVLPMDIGFASFPGNDEPFFLGDAWFRRHADSGALGKELVVGDVVRDWEVRHDEVALAPYDATFNPIVFEPESSWGRHLWRYRRVLESTTGFGGETRKDTGESWWTWYRWVRERYLTPLTITFAFVTTHSHFVLDRGGKVFKQSAPVIKLPEDATEGQHLELLGVLNSSAACFWLKQVSHNKGGPGGGSSKDEKWRDFYEFTGTKLQEFPLPPRLPSDRPAILDSLARDLVAQSPRTVVSKWLTSAEPGDLGTGLTVAAERWKSIRHQMIFQQEELDWETYAKFGISTSNLIYQGVFGELSVGERAFEISLAQKASNGQVKTRWFSDFAEVETTVFPDRWPSDYCDLVRARLELMDRDRGIRLLETPDFKRPWDSVPWERQLREALEGAILDRFEDGELWRDLQGPATRSVAQLADLLRSDEVLLQLARELTGNPEPDLGAVIGSLAPTEAVPYLAAHRYKPSGLEKFREWQSVWDLQRREDDGEKVTIPVPPKYSTPDFQNVEYWKARGKLDVPKERFVLYPGVGREGDNSPVLGWAGWNHRDQAVALVREVMNQQTLGASNEALVPMVAGLVELEPWLHQWHTELEPEFGSSAARAVTTQIDQLLAMLQMTRDDVNAWRPPAAARGRRLSA